MNIFLVFLCIGYTIATSDVNKTESAVSPNPEDVVSPAQQQFEIFSLNSYDAQMPLIIRSRISDNLKPSAADLNNGEPYQLRQELTLPLPNSVEILFNPNPNPNQDVIVQNITSISDLSPIFQSDNSFGFGLMPVEVKEPTFFKPSSFPGSYHSGSTRLIPADLTYSTIFKTGNTTDDGVESDTGRVAATQDLPGKTSSGYSIEKVPQIASYNRTGPFSESDIPSYDELETIFNTTANTTAEKLDDFSQVLEPRAGILPDDAILRESDPELDNVAEMTSPNTPEETTTPFSIEESSATEETLTTEENATIQETNAPELTIWEIIAGNNITSFRSRSSLQISDSAVAENDTNIETQTNVSLETTTVETSNDELGNNIEATTLENTSATLLLDQIRSFANVGEIESNAI